MMLSFFQPLSYGILFFLVLAFYCGGRSMKKKVIALIKLTT